MNGLTEIFLYIISYEFFAIIITMSCLTFQFPLGDKYLSVTDTAGCSVAERPPEDQDEDMKPLPHAEPRLMMAGVTTWCC